MVENIKHLFVSYEIAIKAKTYGFDESCIARYNRRRFEMNKLGDWYHHNSGEIDKNYLSAPLNEQLKLWFLNTHKIFIEVLQEGSSKYLWYKICLINNNKKVKKSTWEMPKYEFEVFEKIDCGTAEDYNKGWGIAFEAGFELLDITSIKTSEIIK